jgi:phage I-like protein
VKKPAFIDRIQRVKAGAVYFAGLSLESATADGFYPVDAFKPGMAEMHEQDWRQFELTPENAKEMVATANADIASGKPAKKLRGNYGHDRSGPKAADVKRVELTAEGGVRQLVQWTERAQADIRAGEWDGTSPEFYAKVVLDEKGNPKEVNGRVLMQPFALTGFALDNDPAMPDLAIAANTETEAPEQGKEATVDMKKLALKLGLPETTTPEDVEKALDEKLKPAPAPEPKAEAATIEAVAAAVLAKINPDKLAKEIRDGAVAQAKEAIRAENHDAACTASVDAAIMGGRVKKSEREQALKLAKSDLEAFKTMTASMKVVAPVSPLYQAGGDSDGKPPELPNAPHPSDHVGNSLDAFAEDSAPAHKLAIAYIEKAQAAGKQVSYREAIVATTRK